MSRTIIVGDVHGCAEELSDLLDRVAFTAGDRLVFVGDLVARGPDSLGVLDIARRTGALLVRGNHEDKLLEWRAKMTAHGTKGRRAPAPLGRTHDALVRCMRSVDWTLLSTAPHWLELPEHGLRIVHAGVLPGIPFVKQDRHVLTKIRTLGPDGRWFERGQGPLWATRYAGPPHILFGHNAMGRPQIHRWATGLDTACVYGGRLTAAVLRADERMPEGEGAMDVLVSVPARRVHFVPARRLELRLRHVA